MSSLSNQNADGNYTKFVTTNIDVSRLSDWVRKCITENE